MFPSRSILLILLLVCPGIVAQAEPSHDEASADLKAVVKQVESLQKALASQRRQQTKAERALSAIEKAEQENKDKPMSDQGIVKLLKEMHGICIARRTVAKYREMLGILSSAKRKKLF